MDQQPPISTEAMLMSFIAIVAGTFVICFICDTLFGKEYGIFPALLISFVLSRKSKKLAEWLSKNDN